VDIAVSLIRRCKDKDGEAFNLLLKKHEGYLYQLCYRFTFDREEALDIMQEIYIKIFHSIGSFDEKRPFLPWLKRIAVNTCLNYKRDHLKGQTLSLEGSGQEEGMGLLEVLAAGDDPEETAILHNTQEILMASLKKLPEQYRMALTLRYLEEMSYEEIAATLDQPLGTVKNRIFRARHLLKTILQSRGILEV
jgi:RNA polymerase sigma-70 factor, ECF subfamily